MATHSTVLAWRIPWTEESGGLQFMGLQRVQPDSATSTSGGSEVKGSASNAGDPGSIPGSGRFPGEERATHSSILAWRISWTEEPGRLQSTGSLRVGHD